MPKKCETNKKSKIKPTRNATNPRSRKNARNNSANISSISVSSTSVLDYTLPEDNHLDSFDRFRADGRRKLRSNLKKKIRPSFNRDSSVEYSSDASTQSNEQSRNLKKSQEKEIEIIHRSPEAKNDNNPEPKKNVDPTAGRKSFQFGCWINSSNSWMFDQSTRERRRKKKAALSENAVASETYTRSKRRKKVEKNIVTKLKKSKRNSGLMVSSTPVQAVAAIKKTKVNESPIFSPIDFNAINWPITKPMEKAKTTIITKRTTIPSPPEADTAHSSDKSCDDVRFSFVRPKSLEENDENDTFEQSRQKTIENIIIINETHEQENSKEDIDTPISISKRVSIRRRPNNIGTKLTYSHEKIRQSAIDIGESIRRSTADHQIRSKLFDSTNSTDLGNNCKSHLDTEGSHLITSVRNKSDIIEATNKISKSPVFDSSTDDPDGSCSDDSNPELTEMQTSNESLSEEESANGSLNEEANTTKLLNEMNGAYPSLIDSQLSNSVNENSSVAETVAVVTVSSTMSGDHSSTSPSTTTAKCKSPKICLRPRVGFGYDDLIHELSNNLQSPEVSNDSPKIVLKGGKWRRTIYDIRKSKLTNSPGASIERKSANDHPPKTSVRPSHAFVISRKSILVKDIPDRRIAENTRKPNQNLVVLDESDAESICSSDFSPRPRSINVLSKLQSSRLLQSIGDCVDFEKRRSQSQYNRRTTGHHHLSLCSTSSTDSVVDDFEDLTSSLNLGYDQQELKAQILKRCGQTKVLSFDNVYSARNLRKCRKIGEGVFGEVFLNEISARSSYVLKIIPIEGVEEINGAQQKRFHEILQEIIISQELSGLRCGKTNLSSGFVKVLNVRLVEGRYPNHLLKLWNDYCICDQTENDCPDVFGDDQLYVVFELANCGLDLEAYIFKNAQQSFSAFKQVALSLAVAESEFQFEHRDLHWGNVLVSPTAEKFITYYLNGKSIEVPTHGVKATIIDYTLSRLVYKNQCLFQDLAADPELFEASGDYQYDIYRFMRTQTNNYWEVFEPYTNVLWLHYILDKMIDGVRYSSRRAIKHRAAIDDMMKLRDVLLEYRSATDYIESDH